jgi:hypothetical protein
MNFDSRGFKEKYNLWSDLSNLVSNFSMGGGSTLQNIEIMVRNHFLNLISNLSLERNSFYTSLFSQCKPTRVL